MLPLQQIPSIGRNLRSDPLAKSESRGSKRRIMVELPLAVYYGFSEPDLLVTVYAVWRVR
jgi:hypothetical protein